MTNYLLAGGGTAGHVNPLLALAEEIRRIEPTSKIVVVGTTEGLESSLVPERGFRLEIIDRLPFPRKISAYAVTFPLRYRSAVAKICQLIVSEKIDVLVGFGGYVSAPAYDAAKKLKLPFVIHEANALPGLANRRAARNATAVAVTFSNTQLPGAVLTGMPLRRELEASLAKSNRAQARKQLGLDPEMVTLLVTGGSLGAKRINETVWKSRKQLLLAGVQVLHIVGNRSDMEPLHENNYLRIKYAERMDLAIASADLAVSRAGAATVCEFAALGLPALFVPYPVGNGEQALNAKSIVDAGGAVMVRDADFDPGYVSAELIPLISDSRKLKRMSDAAKEGAIVDATARLFALVKSVLKR